MTRVNAKEIREAIAKNLKRILKARKADFPSLESFALQNGISNSVLSRLVNGTRTPSVETLVKIAESLEVGLNDLYPMRSSLVKKKSP